MKTGRKWRARRTPDFNRLRAALAGPGADTRAWLAVGRVEEDPDAVRWEDGVGWVADVLVMSGPLATTGEVTCRVMCPFGGDDAINTAPVRSGCVVVLALPDGEANGSPVVLGYLHNTEDCAAASTVNELPIDEDAAAETVLVKTPANLEAEYGDEVRVQAGSNMYFVSPRIDLAPDAVRAPSGEPFVRGGDFGTALGNFLDGVGTFTNTIAGAANVLAVAMQPLVPPNPLAGVAGPLGVYAVAVANAMASFGGWTLVGPLAPGAVPVPFAASAAGVLKATIAPRSQGGWQSEKIYGE